MTSNYDGVTDGKYNGSWFWYLREMDSRQAQGRLKFKKSSFLYVTWLNNFSTKIPVVGIPTLTDILLRSLYKG